MKTFKQFQQDIQEFDQNAMGAGLGILSGIGKVANWAGKAAAGMGANTVVRSVGGSTPVAKYTTKSKWKGPGGHPSGSGVGQAQQRLSK